ncbi:MAG TPA: hypothetical protein VIZ64_12945 [Dokdonella sp.]
MTDGATYPDSGTVPRALVFGAVAVFCLEAFGSLFLDAPQIHADEGSYLLNAAVLAGHLRESLVWGYWSGYSLLLTPAFLAWSQPEQLYHAVLVINALLISSVPFALHRLTRLLWPELPPHAHVTAALVATFYAPLLLLGHYAMAENALIPLHAWLLASCATMANRGRIPAGIASGALAGLLVLVHARGGALALPVLAAMSAFMLRKPALRRPLAVMWIVAITVASLHAPLEMLADRADKLARGHTPAFVWTRLTNPSSWNWIALNLVGSTTQAIVGSFGLLVFAARGAVGELRRATPADGHAAPARSAVLLAAFLAFAGALAVTAVFFVPPSRADQIAYGRYGLPALVPLLAFGVLRIFHRPVDRNRDAAWAIVAGATGILAMGVAFAGLPRGIATQWNFINAIDLYLAALLGPFDDVWITMLACFIFAMVLVHFLAARSVEFSLALVALANLAIFATAWRIVTWPGSLHRNDGRQVVEAARAFEPVAGLPLCIRLDPAAVETWHRVDLGWRLLPQLSTHARVPSACVPAAIRPADDAAPTGMRLVATERASPAGVAPIGLFVASGAALDAFSRVRPLPPADAVMPLAKADRRAELEVVSDPRGWHVDLGTPVRLEIRVTNLGGETWSATGSEFLPHPVRVGAIASDGIHRPTNYRTALPRDIGPGGTDVVILKIGPFRHPGRYDIRVGVVQEHVEWFEGGQTLRMVVDR